MRNRDEFSDNLANCLHDGNRDHDHDDHDDDGDGDGDGDGEGWR